MIAAMQAVIAKCEECGAALRVSGAPMTIACAYCGTTSILAGPDAEPNGPRLRITPAPPVENPYGGGAMAGGLFALVAVGCLLQALLGDSLVPLAGTLLFGTIAGLGVHFYLMGKKEAEVHRWFRDHGLPGRATVQRIVASTRGHSAVLGLQIELSERARYDVEHRTAIPPLLVPRLTKGLSLPVVVHPADQHRVEIQWHLV